MSRRDVHDPATYAMLSSRRSTSPVFKSLPLMTDFLTSGKHEDLRRLKTMWPEYESLFTRFFSYEKSLLGLDESFTRSHDMRELLHVEINSSDIHLELSPSSNPRTDFNASQHGKLCSFLSLYRLVDIMAWIKDIGQRTSASHRPQNRPLPPVLPGYEDLQNWPQTALRFRDLLDATPTSNPKAPTDLSQSSRLLQFLSTGSKKVVQGTIIANLVAAATYISYLREFHRAGDRFPDLPDQISDQVIAEAPTIEERQFLEQLREFVLPLTQSRQRKKSGTVSLASFRGVLQAAALVSSTYLASSTMLPRKSWNKSALIQTSQYLGNDKPPELLEVEKVFWLAIFALADGSLHPNNVMQRLQDTLPWTTIAAVAAAADGSSWFDLSAVPGVPRLQLGRDEALGDAESSQSSRSLPITSPTDDNGSHLPAQPDSTVDSTPAESLNARPPPVTAEIAEGNITGFPAASLPTHSQLDNSVLPETSTSAHSSAPQSLSDTTASTPSKSSISEPSANGDTAQNAQLVGLPPTKDCVVDGVSTQEVVCPPVQLLCTEESGPAPTVVASLNSHDLQPAQVEQPVQPDGDMVVDNADSHALETISTDVRSAKDSEGPSLTSEPSTTPCAVPSDSPLPGQSDVGSASELTPMNTDADTPKATRRSSRIGKKKQVLSVEPAGNHTKSSSFSSAKKRKRSTVAKSHVSSSGSQSTRSSRHPSLIPKSRISDTTGPGSRSNPIDVDLFKASPWEPDNLDSFRQLKEENDKKDKNNTFDRPYVRYQCPTEYTVFDGDGTKVILQPKFHFQDYVRRFDEFMTGIQASYINDKPLFRVVPEASVIRVLTYDEYRKLSPQKLHEFLCQQNIVVRGCPVKDYEFDERGLNFLHPLPNTVPLQDYSMQGLDSSSKEDDTNGASQRPKKRVQDFDDFDKQTKHIPATVNGTLQVLLDNVRAGDMGKTLNALDLPLPSEDTAPKPFSTDRYAFHQTRGRPAFPSGETFPTTDMCWALAGGIDTMTFLHIDSDGFGTHGRIFCGGKLWIFYKDFKDVPLSSRLALLDPNFRLDRYIPPAKYGLEAIYISKGDLLLMRPNQPHAVYGNVPTIVRGGHFYLTHAMEVTAQSLFHSFILNRLVTNTAHYSSRMLLRRIVDFFRLALLEKRYIDPDARPHLPKHETFSGLVNLLSLCNLVILGNVLDFRTYSAPNQKAEELATPSQRILMELYDRNNIPKQERVSMMYARGIALELLNWVRTFCVVTSPAGDVVEDLPSDYICRQMTSLLKYKKEAEEEVEDDGDSNLGAPHCTLQMLERQISNALHCDERIAQYWEDHHGELDDTELGFGPQTGYTLRWKEGEPVLRTYDELLQDGTTELDRLYLEYDAVRFEQDEVMASGDSPPPHVQHPGTRKRPEVQRPAGLGSGLEETASVDGDDEDEEDDNDGSHTDDDSGDEDYLLHIKHRKRART